MRADQGTEFDEWAQDWQLALRGRGIAESTLTVYQRSLDQFTAFLGGDPALGEITGRDVDAFLADLATRGRSDSTRRVRLMALRAFFGWVVEEPQSPLAVSPAGKTKAPVAKLPILTMVSDEDVKAVLATCDARTFIGLRDEAIIRLLASTGLRRAELVGLGLDDVDKRGELYVMGKGSKPRVVSFGGHKTPLAVSRYLRARARHAGSKDKAFLLSTRPSTSLGWRMTGGGIGLMLRRRSKLAGVKQIKPHALRHYWAHTSKVAGLSDEDLERMAGWSSPMMVRRYGRAMADERAREAHKSLNLGDKL